MVFLENTQCASAYRQMTTGRKYRSIPKSKRSAVSAAIRKEYHAMRAGTAHSGSRNGPLVTNPRQAVAIGINIGLKKKKKK